MSKWNDEARRLRSPEYVQSQRDSVYEYLNKLTFLKNNFSLINAKEFDEWVTTMIQEYKDYYANAVMHKIVEDGTFLYENNPDYRDLLQKFDPDIRDRNLNQTLYYLCNTNEKMPAGSVGKLSPFDISEIRKIADHHNYNTGIFGTASILTRKATRSLKNRFGSSSSVGGKRKTRQKKYKKRKMKKTRQKTR